VKNPIIITAMRKMAIQEEAHQATLDAERHKYCNFLRQKVPIKSLKSEDIRNLILHLADFHYIRSELNTLFRIQQIKEHNQAMHVQPN
jgi:uncharacterized protein YehS (DUF1456 family)